jgi:hypothetical protein
MPHNSHRAAGAIALIVLVLAIQVWLMKFVLDTVYTRLNKGTGNPATYSEGLAVLIALSTVPVMGRCTRMH